MLSRLLYFIFMSTAMLCQAACTNISSQNLTASDQYIPIEDLDGEAVFSPDTASLTGRVLYNGPAGSGCFYVDPEMLSAGLVSALADKANAQVCQHPIYGYGVPIDFSGLQEDVNYPNPPEEEHLIILKGTRNMQAYNQVPHVYVFYAKHYEPLF